MLVDWLERVWCYFCRHEWVRDRHKNGRLGLRCMKCMLRREHNLVRIIEWKLPYAPIEPAHDSGFPPPLQTQNQGRSAHRRWSPLSAIAFWLIADR